MEHSDYMIVRYGPPNKFDHARIGTLCKVMLDEQSYDMYEQMSHDESQPRWEYLESYRKKLQSV